MLASISPFAGLPAEAQAFFWVTLAVVLLVDAWTLSLFARPGRPHRKPSAAMPMNADEFTWIFLVPALNEELTIRDSVDRLLAIPLARRQVRVIDDASDDRTDEILQEIDHPDLAILRRELPHARLGKADALNHAYRQLVHDLGDADPDRVIVVIVDADGRLDPDAPRHAARHFTDPSVGGVQVLVRIYNRHRALTWLQDIEFSVYGHLYQAGRNDRGTAGMGGNGQFNRLSALATIADVTGPWRDRLTEDQDLGLRLLTLGWKGRQELKAVVAQQGPSTLRALLRQRTRWAQGNLQAMTLLRPLLRAPLPRTTRLELFIYVLIPLWQAIVGVALAAAIVLALLSIAPFWNGAPAWQLALYYALAFGSTMLGCIAARRGTGPRGWLAGVLIAHLYILYTWLLWPALLRAALRQAMQRREWTKTARDPIEAGGSSLRADHLELG